jgi:hypothetical protein
VGITEVLAVVGEAVKEVGAGGVDDITDMVAGVVEDITDLVAVVV